MNSNDIITGYNKHVDELISKLNALKAEGLQLNNTQPARKIIASLNVGVQMLGGMVSEYNKAIRAESAKKEA